MKWKKQLHRATSSIRFSVCIQYTISCLHDKRSKKVYFCRSPSLNLQSHLILSYHILSYSIISYHILSYFIISYHILSYLIISYPILSYLIISYHILSYPIISGGKEEGGGGFLFKRCKFTH